MRFYRVEEHVYEGGVGIKCVMSQHFSVDVYLEYSQTG